MSSVQYFTPDGLKKLQEELHQLRNVERPRISQQIAEAREKARDCRKMIRDSIDPLK